jgi:23S rRNA (adenine2503-C2)-methyltransferase
MDLQLLEKTLADRGEPLFRAGQVWAWAAKGASGYQQMTDLPAELRETLTHELPFSSLALRAQTGARDGTVKALFATADERPLEAVLMRYPAPPAKRARTRAASARSSICLSSQSGCPLSCTFCATGRMRFARNLSASEILDQALHFHRLQAAGPASRPPPGRPGRGVAAPITHCVFMGMGEPMLNLENVLAACERLPDLGIAHRHTAISTVGWIPGIEALAEQDMPLRLALSLHAAEETLRSELMPVNERFPLREVLDACRAFYARKHRRVLVEYVMLAGINDRYGQALALAEALSRGAARESPIFKVNLIPYNPTASDFDYRGSSSESIASFRAVLEGRNIPTTIRLTRGREIDAACGQLAAARAGEAEPAPSAG